MDNFRKHAEISGSEILNSMVDSVNKQNNFFEIKTVC
jgi:thioredoxin reductase